MNLTEAKAAARRRGAEMQPIPGKSFAYTASDIADIVESVLLESHPLKSMPDNEDLFNKWRKEQDAIRAEIWESFAEGVNAGATINAAAALGALGGSATTDAKAAAARENGKRGGRPRKIA
jgi:hypothetical protein